MSDDANAVMRALQRDGTEIAVRAFRKALGNVESVAKDLCPVGHYGRARGKAGRAGGALQNATRVEYIGVIGNQIRARCVNALPYAAVQHDEAFHHPGLYTGAAGQEYAARYFERAVEIVFGEGSDPLGDPGGQLGGALPAGFQEILEDEQKS